MDLMQNPGYTVAGALTGFVVGMTGVGGGALMTPLLLLVWGISPVTAVATDLWFAAITKLVSAGVHHQTRHIDWQVAKRFWLGSLPAAIIVVLLVSSTKAHLRLEWLNQLIASVILIAACSLVLEPQKIAHHLRSIYADRNGRPEDCGALGGVTAGAVLGLLVTLTSIGAGALGCVFLLILYPGRMTPQRLVGTDIVHAIPLSIVAGSGYLMAGLVDMHMLGSLLLGSLPAVLLGSVACRYLSSSILRGFLAALLAASGLKILLP